MFHVLTIKTKVLCLGGFYNTQVMMESLSCITGFFLPAYPSINGLWVYKRTYIWNQAEEPWIF